MNFNDFGFLGVPDLRRSNSKGLKSLEFVPIFSGKGHKVGSQDGKVSHCWKYEAIRS